MTLNKRTVEIDLTRLQLLEEELDWFKRQRDKLVRLILLVDPAISSRDMNSLSAEQWAEFTRWYTTTKPGSMPDDSRIATTVSACQDSAHLAEV